jgi:hypothetical protein
MEDPQYFLFKRRLFTIFVLNFWSNLIHSLYCPVNPLKKDKDYFFLIIVHVTSILFALFISKRKYRLPRKYIMCFSLVSNTVAMVLATVKGNREGVAGAVLTVLIRIFLGFAWASSNFTVLTLISWLFTEIFQILLAFLFGITLLSYSVGYLIQFHLDLTSRGLTVPFAVVSGGLIPFLYVLLGDLSYSMTQERYTLLDYLKKRVILK